MASQNKDDKQYKHMKALIVNLAMLVAFGAGYLFGYLSEVPVPTKPSSNDPVLLTFNFSISGTANISSLVQTLFSEYDDPHTRNNLESCREIHRKYALMTNPGDNRLALFGENQVRWMRFSILKHGVCLVLMEQGSNVIDKIKAKRLEQCVDHNVALAHKVLPLLRNKGIRACRLQRMFVY